jgi:hypothetical protein
VDQIGTAVGVGSQEEEVGVVAVVVAAAAVAGETGTGSNTDFLKVFYSTVEAAYYDHFGIGAFW